MTGKKIYIVRDDENNIIGASETLDGAHSLAEAEASEPMIWRHVSDLIWCASEESVTDRVQYSVLAVWLQQ